MVPWIPFAQGFRLVVPEMALYSNGRRCGLRSRVFQKGLLNRLHASVYERIANSSSWELCKLSLAIQMFSCVLTGCKGLVIRLYMML